MANLKLEHIYKVYPNGTKAVNDFSLDIKNGEFIVFVGPSGCGKSTTLRMIAGLEEITAGELYIDSTIVNDMEPKDRDIAMVFQNYALYPHMTVYENMAFGLRLRHVPNDVIQEKVLWAADILGIRDYLDRKPRNMSGGQRQRVSLGRAILRDPKVMLLDEPLSNLDAKLRASMRTEIAKLHQKLKTTFIYVTHDQTEAMTLGDRVVVMKAGRIQQVDTPKNLYNFPGNKFVAGFIGTPQMNFFDCSLKRDGEKVTIHIDINNTDIVIDYNYLIKVLPQFLDGNHPLTLGVRCEHVLLAEENEANTIPVKISHFEELGSECLIYGNITNDEKVSSSEGQIIIRVKDVDNLSVDQTIFVKLDLNHIYFFDKETEKTITPRVPEYNSLNAFVKDNKINVLGHDFVLPNVLHVADVDGCELHVPVNAFTLGVEDGIEAKVIEIEEINDTKLIHLFAHNRVFFLQEKANVSVGDVVKVGLDFTRLTLVDQNKEVIFSPITERDCFDSTFLNYETVMASNPNPEFEAYKQAKIEEASKTADALIAAEQARFDAEIENLSTVDVKAEFEKKAAEFEALDKEAIEKIYALREQTAAEKKELSENFKKAKKEEKEKNDALFAEKKRKEIEDFKRFKENNKDKVALKRRTDEYHIFKDNFATEKENTLNLIVNGMTMEYESKSSALTAACRRSVDLLKKEMQERRKTLKHLQNPKAFLEKEHVKKVKELLLKKKEAVKFASFIFFFKLPGSYYPLAAELIANKLIQGLGTRVFTKNFYIEMPHDGYEIVEEDNNCFHAVVEENLDYGNIYFIRLSYTGVNGEKLYFYLKNDKPFEIGTKLNLKFDITKSQITETDMNIRLY